jgi:ethanolamine ammonia-lyase small subunit
VGVCVGRSVGRRVARTRVGVWDGHGVGRLVERIRDCVGVGQYVGRRVACTLVGERVGRRVGLFCNGYVQVTSLFDDACKQTIISNIRRVKGKQ